MGVGQVGDGGMGDKVLLVGPTQRPGCESGVGGGCE